MRTAFEKWWTDNYGCEPSVMPRLSAKQWECWQAAHERCAWICDKYAQNVMSFDRQLQRGAEVGAGKCAEEIRRVE